MERGGRILEAEHDPGRKSKSDPHRPGTRWVSSAPVLVLGWPVVGEAWSRRRAAAPDGSCASKLLIRVPRTPRRARRDFLPSVRTLHALFSTRAQRNEGGLFVCVYCHLVWKMFEVDRQLSGAALRPCAASADSGTWSMARAYRVLCERKGIVLVYTVSRELDAYADDGTRCSLPLPGNRSANARTMSP